MLFYLNLVLVLHFKTARCSFQSLFFIVLSKIVWSKWFLKRKATKNFDQGRKQRKNEAHDDVMFVKQVPMHPKGRLARETERNRNNDNVVFVKQVTMYPRDRRNRKLKRLTYLRNRMKFKELQILANNISTLMTGNFSFSLEKLLNKSILFDVSRIDEGKNKGQNNWKSALY